MASEIRVDKITSLSGVGTITPSSSGIDITGITTVATLKATTGIVTTLTATTGIVTTFEATTGDITTLRAPTGISTHFTADKISLPDSTDGSLCIGIGSDLKFNHNGTDSFITEVGGGDLYIQGSDIILRDAGTLEKHIEMTQNGAVDIYHNGTKKLETKSDGVLVTGEIQASTLDINGSSHLDGTAVVTGNLDMPDSVKILLGTGDDLEVFHDSSNSIIKNNTGFLLFKSDSGINLGDASDTDNYLKTIKDGAVELYYDGSKRIVTTNYGISVTRQNAGESFRVNANYGASGDQAIETTGDLTFYTNSGSIAARLDQDGLKFNADTAAANGLDDYEEGSWTPDFRNRTSAAPNIQEGRYRKIGNQVFAYLHLNYNTTLTSSDTNLILTGLPFTSSSGHSVYGAMTSIHMNNSLNLSFDEAFLNGILPPNTTNANIYLNSAASMIQVAVSRFGTGNILTCVVYFTD